MLRRSWVSVGSLTIAGLVLFASSLVAQQPGAVAQRPDAEAQRQRFFEALRRAGAGEGIGIVQVPGAGASEPIPTFEGDGEGIGIVQIPGSIDPQAVADEVAGAIESPGASGRTIQYEVSIVHLASSEDFSEEETAVTGETADALLASWRERGLIVRRSTIRFTGVEGQEASVQIGEQVPVATARASFGGGRGGPMQTSFDYRDVGTMVSCTGRVAEEGIVVESQVEESRLDPSRGASSQVAQSAVADAAAAILGAPGAAALPNPGEGFSPSSTQQVNARTTTTVPDGGTMVLAGMFSKSKESSSATIIALKASILQ